VSSQALNHGMQKKEPQSQLCPSLLATLLQKQIEPSYPPLGEVKRVKKKIEFYSRNKDKHSRQVPYCNVYFIAYLVFLVLQCWFQFLN